MCIIILKKVSKLAYVSTNGLRTEHFVGKEVATGESTEIVQRNDFEPNDLIITNSVDLKLSFQHHVYSMNSTARFGILRSFSEGIGNMRQQLW